MKQSSDLTLFVIIFLFLTGPFYVFSQQDSVTIDSTKIFIENHPQDAQTATLAFISKNGNHQVGIGGFARMQASYDFGGLANSTNFETYNIPVGAQSDSVNGFRLSVGQSRLNFEVLGNTDWGSVRIFLEGDFLGSGSRFRLRHAFGQFQGLTVGQTWTTMSDVEAIPFTVDFEGPNSSIYFRTPLVRYEWNSQDKWRFAIAIEEALPDFLIIDGERKLPQRFPDFVGRIKKFFPWGSLQVSSVFRIIDYRNPSDQGISTTPGWGIALGGVIKVSPKDKFMFQGVTGIGITKYIGGISGKEPDLDTLNSNGGIGGLPAGGAYLAFQHDWSKKLQTSLILSYTEVSPLDTRGPDSFYQSYYYAMNILYSPAKIIRIGSELNLGARVNKDGQSGIASRLSVMMQFNI